MKVIASAALLLLLPAMAAGHVNSPHAHREARVAGHDVVAVVHLPRAVPGEAEAQLRITRLPPDVPVEVDFRQIPPQGDAQAPAFVPATRSEVDPAFFTAAMPLMVFGLFEAEFRVRIGTNEGFLRVPVTARNPEPLTMPAPTVAALLALAAFLTVSACAIGRSVGTHGSSAREGDPSPAEARRGWLAGVAASTGFLIFVGFSCFTWFHMHRAFEARARPPIAAEWVVRNGTPRVGKPLDASFLLTDPDGRPVTGLLASDGHAVHVTAIALPAGDHVVHAHGVAIAPGTFSLAWTPRHAGRHVVFLDFGTRETGQLTLVQDLIAGPAFPEPGARLAPHVVIEGAALPPLGDAAARDAQSLGDGWSAQLSPPDAPAAAGDVLTLAFALKGDEPAAPPPGALELIVVREDMSVYDRLAPAAPRDEDHAPGVAAARFVYGFPHPGRYRLILTRLDGATVRAAAFDLDVT